MLRIDKGNLIGQLSLTYQGFTNQRQLICEVPFFYIRFYLLLILKKNNFIVNKMSENISFILFYYENKQIILYFLVAYLTSLLIKIGKKKSERNTYESYRPHRCFSQPLCWTSI